VSEADAKELVEKAEADAKELVAKAAPHAQGMRKACEKYFPACMGQLNQAFEAKGPGTGSGPPLLLTRISGAALYANALYGILAKVHAATVPSLLTVSVRLFDSFTAPPCTESWPGGW
jgi:hypothetical protein